MGRTLRISVVFVIVAILCTYLLLFINDYKKGEREQQLQKTVSEINTARKKQTVDKTKLLLSSIASQIESLYEFSKDKTISFEGDQRVDLVHDTEKLVAKHIAELLESAYVMTSFDDNDFSLIEEFDSNRGPKKNDLKHLSEAIDLLKEKLHIFENSYAIGIMPPTKDMISLTETSPAQNVVTHYCKLDTDYSPINVQIIVERIKVPEPPLIERTVKGTPIEDAIILPKNDIKIATFTGFRHSLPELLKPNDANFIEPALSENDLNTIWESDKKHLWITKKMTDKEILVGIWKSDINISYVQAIVPKSEIFALPAEAEETIPMGWAVTVGMLLLSFGYLWLIAKYDTTPSETQVPEEHAFANIASLNTFIDELDHEQKEAENLLKDLEKRHQIKLSPAKTNIELGEIKMGDYDGESDLLKELMNKVGKKK